MYDHNFIDPIAKAKTEAKVNIDWQQEAIDFYGEDYLKLPESDKERIRDFLYSTYNT